MNSQGVALPRADRDRRRAGRRPDLHRAAVCSTWPSRQQPMGTGRRPGDLRDRRAAGRAARACAPRNRALKARAEASERLSGEIIASLTSGLLVVDESGMVRTLNPAALRMLGMPPADWNRPFRELLAGAAPLADVIDECLQNGGPIVRRTISMSGRRAPPTSASPCRRSCDRRHPRRDLPVHRSDRGDGARRAAAPEGQPGAARRADRRHRPRVPQRSGDDSWLRAADRARSAAAGVPPVRRGHPQRNRGARRDRDQLPQFRQAHRAGARPRGHARDRGTRRGRHPRRRARRAAARSR